MPSPLLRWSRWLFGPSLARPRQSRRLSFDVLEDRCTPSVSVQTVVVDGVTEQRLFQDNFHLATVLRTTENLVAIRFHPDQGDANGWGSTIYLAPYLGPPTGGGAGGKPIADAPTVTPDNNTQSFGVMVAGNVNRSAGVNYGTFAEQLTITYDAVKQTIHTTGTMSIALTGTVGAANAALNLGKTDSNYLANVPLRTGGTGNTGDLRMVQTSYAAAGDPRDFTWDIQGQPQHFPTDASTFLKFTAFGTTNVVDAEAVGVSRIDIARKPTVTVTYEAQNAADVLSAGLSFATDQGKNPYADNIELVQQVKTSSNLNMMFGVTLDAARPPGIEITTLAPYGNGASFRGKVTELEPSLFSNYVVAPFIYIDGLGWYNKPSWVQKTVAINGNGTFDVNFFPSGDDNSAMIVAAALIPATEAGLVPDVGKVNDGIPDYRVPDLHPVAIDFKERYSRTFQFAGRMWGVKESPLAVSPDFGLNSPNRFSSDANDIFVDNAGRLHLRLTKHSDGNWYATEVFLLEHLGLGTYSFQTQSHLETLDGNVTFGAYLFDSYGDNDNSQAMNPGREVDFEDNSPGIDPKTAQEVIQRHDLTPANRDPYLLGPLGDNPTLTRILRWESDQIGFATVRGNHTPTDFSQPEVIHQYLFPHEPAKNHFVPAAGRERFRFNLWLNGGGAPSNGQSAEVIITNFAFTPPADVFADYGAAGLSHWTAAGDWQLLRGNNPEATAVSLTGDVYGDFGALGLHRWTRAAGWVQLTPVNPQQIIVGGNGTLYGDFGLNLGVWRWTASDGWRQLTNVDPDGLTVLPAGNTDDLYGDFGASFGVWRWTGSWAQLKADNPDELIVASSGDVYGDFGSGGLMRWVNGTQWQLLSAANPEGMTTAANGDLYGDFGGLGVWLYTRAITSWQKLNNANAERLAVGKDGSLFADLGGMGLWRRTSPTGFVQLTPVNPEDMIVALNGDLFADFGNIGVWRWNLSSVWRLLKSANAEGLAAAGNGRQ